jgi:hypothetical protein
MNGSNTHDQLGTYGTLGTGAPGNSPGARYLPVSWPQASGNLWLFGGVDYLLPSGPTVYFNDLWEYAPATTAQGHGTRNRTAAKLAQTPP